MSVRGIVFSALFAALFAVLSFVRIHLPGTPVPIVLENMVPMLAGALIGPVYGFVSMALVIVLALLGVPIIGGSGGMGTVFGFTGGYILAWPLDALLIGWFVSKVRGSGRWAFIQIGLTILVFGGVLTYVIGVPWLAAVAKMPLSKALAAGCYPYLPGDFLKVVVTTLIVFPVRRVYPMERLLGRAGSNVAKLENAQ